MKIYLSLKKAHDFFFSIFFGPVLPHKRGPEFMNTEGPLLFCYRVNEPPLVALPGLGIILPLTDPPTWSSHA